MDLPTLTAADFEWLELLLANPGAAIPEDVLLRLIAHGYVKHRDGQLVATKSGEEAAASRVYSPPGMRM